MWLLSVFFQQLMEDKRDLAWQLREVKRMLRGVMSGPVSASMREQGLAYKVNFGVDQPRLREMRDEIVSLTDDAAALAQALWKENIRECRILACMIMPRKAFEADLAQEWVSQLRYAEEAQALTMYLLADEDYAVDLAFRLVAADDTMQRLVAWLIFGRVFSMGKSLRERDADEWLDHVAAELHDQTADMELRRTALNALNRYMDLGKAEEARGMRILNALP